MKILLTGATGFIGARLLRALHQRHHDVLCVGRRAPPLGRHAALDMADATSAAAWRQLLDGVDAVVNAVGIFREQGRQTFAALHDAAPRALFDACAEAGVARVVQLSALGAERAETAYQRSKHAADRHLLDLPLEGVVAQPSLVFGPGGASSAAFLRMAALPVFVLPEGGRQPVQPVHVDDVVDALVALVEAAPAALPAGRRLAVVGPAPSTFAGYLQALRRGLGLRPARVLALPRALADAAARLGDRRRGALFDSAAWSMLRQGSTAPAAPLARLLGHAPRPPERFVEPGSAAAWRQHAQLAWLQPLLRASLGVLWIATAVVSFGLYPRAASYELLARTGVPPALQPSMLDGAAALDLAFGVLTLLPPRRAAWRRRLWEAQAALIGFYTVVISLRLPGFWLHPYGPMTKNLPVLALLAVLWALDGADEEQG